MREKIILQGEKAIELWQQGKDAWNYWVKQNPEADISFSKVNFSSAGDRSFREFYFPNGNISFQDADFGGCNVSFQDANFGDGNVNFKNANFGEKSVYFKGAKFGAGDVSFEGANFNDGYVSFEGVNFGDGHVIFSAAKFGQARVCFYNSIFGKGNVVFFGTLFKEGDVTFEGADFGKGNVSFKEAAFGKGNIIFKHTIFGQHADFSALRINKEIKSIDFRYAVFNGSLEFSTISEINIIPDFVGTKTTNHTSFNGLKYKLKRKALFSKVISENNSESLCRLKEIAESNKDHAMALRFHADEMRSKRWQKERMGTAASLLDWLFDIFSLYGQSIWRPIVGLLLTIATSLLYTVGFCFPILSPSSYAQWFTNMENISYQTWVYGFEIAVSRAIPFLGGARVDAAGALTELKPILSINFSLLSMLFSLLAFVFIFLIGLGLRNRFRL
ncbi:hypothetical protein [Photobacterium damselae]|uniref:hypothetical protein n=1 Tax=Photobacterium damselae TaxID=38293 RepID=UPI0030F48422